MTMPILNKSRSVYGIFDLMQADKHTHRDWHINNVDSNTDHCKISFPKLDTENTWDISLRLRIQDTDTNPFITREYHHVHIP